MDSKNQQANNDMREQIRLKMTQDKKNTKPASNNQSVSKPTPVTQAANDATRGFQTTTAPTIATAPKEKKEKAKKSSLSALEAKLTAAPTIVSETKVQKIDYLGSIHGSASAASALVAAAAPTEEFDKPKGTFQLPKDAEPNNGSTNTEGKCSKLRSQCLDTTFTILVVIIVIILIF